MVNGTELFTYGVVLLLFIIGILLLEMGLSEFRIFYEMRRERITGKTSPYLKKIRNTMIRAGMMHYCPYISISKWFMLICFFAGLFFVIASLFIAINF